MIPWDEAQRYFEHYSRFNIPVISDLYALDFDGINRRWVYFNYSSNVTGYVANVIMLEKIPFGIEKFPYIINMGSFYEFPSPTNTELYKSLYE